MLDDIPYTPSPSRPLILQVVGYKNSGKTTLLCKLVERFKRDGRVVATIKHDAHDFEIDRPHTDTWQHQEAGADMTAITSPYRTAWLSRTSSSLDELIARMAGADVILIEGFKDAPYPKLVLLKQAADLPLLELKQPCAAVMREGSALPPHPVLAELPQFTIDDIDGLYRFLAVTAPLHAKG